MNALTGAERTRNLRLRNKAAAFSKDYLEGETRVSPEEFIGAKVNEACDKHGFADVQMNHGVVNDFYTLLADRSFLELGVEPIDPTYIQVVDMVEAWGDAEKERG